MQIRAPRARNFGDCDKIAGGSGDYQLFDNEIPPADDLSVALAAAGAVALVLDDGEGPLAVPADALALHDFYFQLRAREARVLHDEAVDVLHILRNDQGEVADLQHYRVYLIKAVGLRKGVHRCEYLPDYAYLMHGQPPFFVHDTTPRRLFQAPGMAIYTVCRAIYLKSCRLNKRHQRRIMYITVLVPRERDII